MYTTLRNGIEGGNGTAKRDTTLELAVAARRPGRGIAAQSLYVAFIFFAENKRRIDLFMEQAEATDDGDIVVLDPRKSPRRRPRPSGFYRRPVVYHPKPPPPAIVA